MAGIVTFAPVSMCWNAEDVKPFKFDNTMTVEKGHPVQHLVDWTAVVARGTREGRLQALVLNCHGHYGFDHQTGVRDSAGGIPVLTGGFGLSMGEGIGMTAAKLFGTLAGLVGGIHIYGCGAAATPLPDTELTNVNICQIMADAARCPVVASTALQPDVEGPGLNMAPAWVGKVVRFTPQ